MDGVECGLRLLFNNKSLEINFFQITHSSYMRLLQFSPAMVHPKRIRLEVWQLRLLRLVVAAQYRGAVPAAT